MFKLITILFDKQIEAEVKRRCQVEMEYRDKVMVEKLCFLGLILFKRNRRRNPGIKAAKHIVVDAQSIALVNAVVLPAIIRKALNNK